MKLIGKIHLIAGILGALAIVAFQADSVAQGRLTIGGNRAHFGTHQLRGGFTPDPKVIHVVSGGNLDTSTMGYGAGCRGWATAQPDVILRYAGGREVTLGDLQEMGMTAGINALIVGNYLTTLGRAPQEDIVMLDKLRMPIGTLSRVI